MENTDVATSDKARSSEHYSEMDRGPATQNDISQRDSSPSGKAMDKQREAQEYIRNRRAQATVADETDENAMADNVAQFGPQNISRESEDDEQKLLATLAEKYNYNLYLPPGKPGSPVIEHTNYAAQLHRNQPSSLPQKRQITDGHDSWHHSRPRNLSDSPPTEDPPRSPSPSIRQLDSTQITPSPPPPIPTAPISDFRPGPIFSTSHMPYQANNSRPTYTTNLRQYADRNRIPAHKQAPERSGFENNTTNSGTQPPVNSQLSERYRHNQIVSPQHQKSQSPQAAPTQWAAPKPARNNTNIVQNLQDSQALKLAESGPQPSRLHPVSYPPQSRQEAAQQNIEQGHDSSHQNGPELWSSNNRLPQKNYPTPDSISSNSRRQMSYPPQSNVHNSPKAFSHVPAGQIAHVPQSHHGGHGHETYGSHQEHNIGPSNYGYDQNSQGEFSSPTTIPNRSNFTPESHGNSTRGHAGGYSSELQFEQAMDGRRPQMHGSGSISSPALHRHSNVVDWRTQICQLFNAPPDSHDEDLFKMLEMTRSKLLPDNRDASQEKLALPYHTIYRVRCHQKKQTHMFLDTPWVVKDSPTEHIHGSMIVRNIVLHTQQYTNLSFIVYKDYTCCKSKTNILKKSDIVRPKSGDSERFSSNDKNELAEFLEGESVCLIGSELSAGLKRLTRQNIQENSYYPSFNVGTEFKAPYPWFYHQRAPLEERRRQLKPELLTRVNSFVEYVNESFGPEYAIVDTLLSQGKISRKYLCYLYSPETVILRTDKHDEGKKKAYLTKSWLHLPVAGSTGNEESATLVTSLLVSSWTFDGLFQENVELITIDDFKSSEEVVKITALNTYPMRYADPTIGASLRKQGEMFWKFRNPSYVYYSEEDESEDNIGQSRYMIDVETYKKLHSKSAGVGARNRDDLGPLVMASDSPPEGVFTLLLPSNIIGFNIQEKKWVDLEVSRMYEVKWNKDAFESLARDNDTKILITSLVANQIKGEQNPGLISRKGNGSVILLHGFSGTGKTMTAESVAEVVERPLYITSCSEIGTTPEVLEKSLQQIFYLGRVWKCVILLEEAEIFLEKRTLGDIHRNALFSVFLRALESYSGIVILTSSPITTMDDSLKSRIQLSLRYNPLNLVQRARIWETHIKQLESLESLFNPSTINISELRANLPTLAKHKLNGHEIGHAIRTARQLALWKGIPMGFEEVQYAISASGRYDDADEEEKKNVGELMEGVVKDADDDPYDGVEDLMSVAGL